MRKRLLVWLMNTELFAWLLKHIVPYIRFTTYYTSLRGAKYHSGYEKLKPGHILLTIDKKKLTSLLIPGTFAHAALCVSKGNGVGYEVARVRVEAARERQRLARRIASGERQRELHRGEREDCREESQPRVDR